MIRPEVLQGIAANQPGDGGTQNREKQFNNCDHTKLLLPQRRQLVGGSLKRVMFRYLTDILEKVTGQILQNGNFPPGCILLLNFERGASLKAPFLMFFSWKLVTRLPWSYQNIFVLFARFAQYI
jgi:hypothetical protein